MKKLGGESGQTLIMVALSMAALLGFAAFATDIGVMLHEKRLVQSATDSAAVASALALSQGTDPVAAGKTDAAANGFTDGATDSNGNTITTVNIYTTPIDGHFVGQSGYTEAVITQQTSGFFMRLFGRDFMNISARAVATDKGVGACCLCTVKPTGTTMQFQGSFHTIAPACPVKNLSSDPCATTFKGGAGNLTSGGFSIVGGDCGQTGDSTPAAVTNALYTGDPLAGQLTPPTYGSVGSTTCPLTASVGNSSSQTTITNTTGTVCYSSAGNIQLTNVTLSPGTYVFNNPSGSLVLSGNITGSGVTLYLLGGMNELSGTNLNLSAPLNTDTQTYAYNGILIYGATSDAPPSTAKLCPTGTANAGPGIIQLNLGNAQGNFSGDIYAPSSAMVFQDSGSDSNGPDFVTDIIVGTFCDETADINITSYAKTVNGGRFPKISLVE